MAGLSSVSNEEDFIFDTSDDLPEGNDPGVVRHEPSASVPANDQPLGNIPEPHDSAMVSEAIRQLAAGQLQTQPLPANPQTPAATQQRGQQQGQQQALPHESPEETVARLTRERDGILRELREERQRGRQGGQQGQPGQQPQPQQRDLAQELFENPEAVIGELRRGFATELAGVRLEFDLDRAASRHGVDNFQPAFDAFMAQVGNPEKPDPLTYQRIMSASSPGEEIVQWHREQSVMREVGNDPSAYRERMIADHMASLGLNPDGTPLQQQPQAPQQQQGHAPAPQPPRADNGQFAPRHEVRLPTPTSRMRGSSGAGHGGGEDGSDDAIFDAGRGSSRR